MEKMFIGERIKFLRTFLSLNQTEFAKELGITHGSVSKIENAKKAPSEQLILSICRTFGVSYEWLTEGKGEMSDKSQRLTPKGLAVIEEIIRRLESPDRTMSLSAIAYVFGIDPQNVPNDSKFPKEFYDALYYLIEIFKDEDRRSIDAVIGLLSALDPRKTKTSKDNPGHRAVQVKKRKVT